MPVRLIRSADLNPRPWKNGGGSTREIAASPEEAGYDRFDWRFSMADIRENGPFSTFPGVDRTLALIDGTGFTLDLPGRSVVLDDIGAVVSFDGNDAAQGRLQNGPIRDFNVMTRRAAYTHTVRSVGPGFFTTSLLSLLLAHAEPTDVRVGDDILRLERFDALLIDTPAAFTVSGSALLASVEPQWAVNVP